MDKALNHLPGMDLPSYVLHTEALKNYHTRDDMDYEDVDFPVRSDDTRECNKNPETTNVITMNVLSMVMILKRNTIM